MSKSYPDTPEGFQRFLRDGKERVPRLYGPGEEKQENAPAKPILVRHESLKDSLVNIEEIDWKKRAANEDEWDGFEDVEPEN